MAQILTKLYQPLFSSLHHSLRGHFHPLTMLVEYTLPPWLYHLRVKPRVFLTATKSTRRSQERLLLPLLLVLLVLLVLLLLSLLQLVLLLPAILLLVLPLPQQQQLLLQRYQLLRLQRQQLLRLQFPLNLPLPLLLWHSVSIQSGSSIREVRQPLLPPPNTIRRRFKRISGVGNH